MLFDPAENLKALQDAVQEELLLAQGQAEHERAAAHAQQQVDNTPTHLTRRMGFLRRVQDFAYFLHRRIKLQGQINLRGAKLARRRVIENLTRPCSRRGH